MKNKFTMRKSDPKVRKTNDENLDLKEIQLDREKVAAATKLLPPVPKKPKLIKKEVNVEQVASVKLVRLIRISFF